MQTTDQRPAILLCLLLSVFGMYAGFVCIRIAAGHDVRPDVAVWAILATLVLLGASAARNAALRARASRARENGGLGASAYGRLSETTRARIDNGFRRRASEISEGDWEEQRALRDAPATRSFMGMDDDPGLENWGPTDRRMDDVRRAEAEFVTPACNGDELLCEMMQELDDMLGDAVDDPDGIAPESWRTIGRVWRDICIANGIDQPTYMHRDPDHWDATPEHAYDDAIEAAGPAMHEAAGG